MAGDWIKMRGALLDHPKVVAIARELQKHHEFREWLTPGGASPMNGKIVSDEASRAVTVALLLRAWSIAREHGKFDGDDLYLEHSCIEDLDQLAGAPGFGAAMESVHWVRVDVGRPGIILPNFKEFNVPMTEAERAKEYRDRKKKGVTNPSRTQRDGNTEIVTTRVEKSRDITPIVPAGFEAFWKTYPGPRKVGKAKCAAVWVAKQLEQVSEQVVLHVEAMKLTPQWREGNGQFVPAPLTYLSQRRFEDGMPDVPKARLAI